MAVSQTAVVTRERQYPHLDRIGDDATFSSFRLLWDQTYRAQERLTAAEATISSLLAAVNTLQTQVTSLQRDTQATLAETQVP